MNDSLCLTVRAQNGDWLVEAHGLAKAGPYPTREDAVEVALTAARRQQIAHACRVIVRNARDEIDFERRFGPKRWPPRQDRYFHYGLTRGSRRHEQLATAAAAG